MSLIAFNILAALSLTIPYILCSICQFHITDSKLFVIISKACDFDTSAVFKIIFYNLQSSKKVHVIPGNYCLFNLKSFIIINWFK